jgi:hypothetical protein
MTSDFHCPHSVDVDFGFAERDPPGIGIGRFVDQPGHMQKGLGGNAPAVKANTAGVLCRIDEGDGHAHISGQEGSRIAAGPGTDDRHLCIIVSHGRVLAFLYPFTKGIVRPRPWFSLC